MGLIEWNVVLGNSSLCWRRDIKIYVRPKHQREKIDACHKEAKELAVLINCNDDQPQRCRRTVMVIRLLAGHKRLDSPKLTPHHTEIGFIGNSGHINDVCRKLRHLKDYLIAMTGQRCGQVAVLGGAVFLTRTAHLSWAFTFAWSISDDH